MAYNKNNSSTLHDYQKSPVKQAVAILLLLLVSIFFVPQPRADDAPNTESQVISVQQTEAQNQDTENQGSADQSAQTSDTTKNNQTSSDVETTDSDVETQPQDVQDEQTNGAIENELTSPGETTLDNEAEEEEQTSSWFSDIHWGGYFKNETAFRYKEPRSVTKIRNIFALDASYTFSPRYSMFFSGWAYYDLVYDLFNYDTISGRAQRDQTQPLAFIFNLNKDKDSLGADIRELYLDMSFSKVDVRIGRQFVVWGLLEGVRIVDEINPIDFRELILPDLLDYRIPLWMLKLDYYRREGTWEFLWIPDIRFHKPAPPGSEWELLQEVPGTVFPDSSDPANWEYGLRLSTHFWDADFTFSYFYTWDDFQVVFRNILINQITIEPEFFPRYTRIRMYGSTMNKQIGNYILKTELAYVTGKYFAVADIDRDNDGFLDSQGEFQRDHIRWGMGLEFNWKGVDIAPGITQWVILDYDPAIIQDHYDTSVNLFIRKPMPKKSMLFEFLAIDFVTLKELYFNPEWTFLVTDRFQVSVGFDVFNGQQSQFGVLSNTIGEPDLLNQRSQFIGNFHDNDRVYAEFKYSF